MKYLTDCFYFIAAHEIFQRWLWRGDPRPEVELSNRVHQAWSDGATIAGFFCFLAMIVGYQKKGRWRRAGLGTFTFVFFLSGDWAVQWLVLKLSY